MEERVKELLEQRFPGARVELETETDSGKLGGLIVWDGFDDMEFIDRQSAVFDFLRRQLGSEAQQLTLIFTYTYMEYHAMEAA